MPTFPTPPFPVVDAPERVGSRPPQCFTLVLLANDDTDQDDWRVIILETFPAVSHLVEAMLAALRLHGSCVAFRHQLDVVETKVAEMVGLARLLDATPGFRVVPDRLG